MRPIDLNQHSLGFGCTSQIRVTQTHSILNSLNLVTEGVYITVILHVHKPMQRGLVFNLSIILTKTNEYYRVTLRDTLVVRESSPVLDF